MKTWPKGELLFHVEKAEPGVGLGREVCRMGGMCLLL